MIYIILLWIEIFILFLLSREVSKSFSKFMPINMLFSVLLPGIILHELAHFLMATILFVPTGEIEFMPKKDGEKLRLGSIKMAKTDPFRRFIIGIAPIILGIVVIVGLTYLFTSNYSSISNANIYIHIFLFLAFIYILFAVSNTMFSSEEDMKGALELLIFTVVVFVTLYFLGFHIPLGYFRYIFTDKLFEAFRLSSMFLLIPIGIDSFLLGAIRIFRS